MKYLGEMSLSSVISKILIVVVWVTPAAVMALMFILGTLSFGTAVDDPTVSPYAHFKYELFKEVQADDKTAWEVTRHSPTVVKVFIQLYILLTGTYIFLIAKTSQKIFANFATNVVFSEVNTRLTSTLTRRIIVFALITFNFSTLLLGVILLILNDIFRSGTALQEESDLTV